MKPIHIIGGGLAGLTLGIALRQRGISVRITEAGRYPRHRVCGEFISGRGVKVLSQLGLEDKLLARGARSAKSTAFFGASREYGRAPLPQEALCIARYELDSLLAQEFERAGGDLVTNQAIPTTPGQHNHPPGTVWATGRRAHPTDGAGCRWFGLKVHMRRVQLEAGLEMHLGRESYVGLCQVSEEEVNVCGLFRRRAGQPIDPRAALRGDPGTTLYARLTNALPDEASFCSVAGLSLQPERISPHECRIGDALTMIPPITGNGMSMAFESAMIAADPLCRYATGQDDWKTTLGKVAGQLRHTFQGRLRTARILHKAVFSSAGSWLLAPALFHIPGLWRAAFHATR